MGTFSLAAAPLPSGAESFVDENKNGWDDRWEAAYPEIDTTRPMDDANGDGTPNIFEMIAGQDPYAERPAHEAQASDPVDTAPTPAQRAEWERRRLVLAPYMNRGLRDAGGMPASRVSKWMEYAERSRTLALRLERDRRLAGERKAEFLASPAGRNLPANLRSSFRDVIDGHPVFDTALSHDQAVFHNVTGLWPGGFSGIDLTGAGETIAVWDGGQVNPLHEQLGTARVDNIDPGAYSEHAMAVATVLIGEGDPTESSPGAQTDPGTNRARARGMAYEAGLRVFSQPNDLTEMAAHGADLMEGLHDIVFSNHSYGVACGWQRLLTGIPSIDDASLWNWYGNPALGNGQQEHKMSLYLASISDELDQIVCDAPAYLPIFAAGNESANLSLPQSPDPADKGGFSENTPHFAVQTGQTFNISPIPTRKLDNSYGGNISPQAAAKNVLTVTSHVEHASLGPTDDMRFKPELWANGGLVDSPEYYMGALNSGTNEEYRPFAGSSYACAVVTGGMTLVRQRWRQVHGNDQMVMASTWKALALAGAAGPFSDSFGDLILTPNIPNRTGYGHFRPDLSVIVIEADADPETAALHPAIKEVILTEAGVSEFEIVASRANGTGHLGVLICWTDPPPDQNPPSNVVDPTTVVLRNDIDVRVIDSNETVHYPYRQTGTLHSPTTSQGDNDRDNVELVHVDYPQPEEVFTVRISHKGTLLEGAQLVSVIMLNAEAVIAPEFRIVDFSRTGEHAFGLSWGSVVGAVYAIEMSDDLAMWTTVGGEVIASLGLTTVEIDASSHGPASFYRVRQLW